MTVNNGCLFITCNGCLVVPRETRNDLIHGIQPLEWMLLWSSDMIFLKSSSEQIHSSSSLLKYPPLQFIIFLYSSNRISFKFSTVDDSQGGCSHGSLVFESHRNFYFKDGSGVSSLGFTILLLICLMANMQHDFSMTWSS